MRKTLSMLLLAATLPVAAIAAAEQGHPGNCDGPGHPHPYGMDGKPGMPPMHGMDGKRGMEPMYGLNLTPEQRKAMHKARQQSAQEKREITKRYLDKLPEADKEAMQKDLQASREKAGKAFRDLLTPEQLKQYEERKAERAKRHAEWEEFRKWKAEQAAKQN